MGRGNENFYRWSRSHDQDGGHAHIHTCMVKTFKSLLLWSQKSYDLETWHDIASGTQTLQILYPGMTLTYFTPRSNLDAYTFEYLNGKTVSKSFNGKNLKQITKLTE